MGLENVFGSAILPRLEPNDWIYATPTKNTLRISKCAELN